jgi:hypothetical protein
MDEAVSDAAARREAEVGRSCPGRGAAFFTLLRRAGTSGDTARKRGLRLSSAALRAALRPGHEIAAAVLGGIGTIAIALLWMKLFPTLRHVETLE